MFGKLQRVSPVWAQGLGGPQRYGTWNEIVIYRFLLGKLLEPYSSIRCIEKRPYLLGPKQRQTMWRKGGRGMISDVLYNRIIKSDGSRFYPLI